MTPPSMTAMGVRAVRRWSRIRGAVGWLCSAALRLGGGGEGDRDRRGEGVKGGDVREAFAASGGKCPRWTVLIKAGGSMAW